VCDLSVVYQWPTDFDVLFSLYCMIVLFSLCSFYFTVDHTCTFVMSNISCVVLIFVIYYKNANK